MGLMHGVGATAYAFADWPTADDASAYEALSPWVSIGKVTSFPPLGGTTEFATFDDLATGEESKHMGMHRAGNGTLGLGLDQDDSGQGILETAEAATAEADKKVAFKFELVDGTVYYRKGFVVSYMPTTIDTGNVVAAECQIEFVGRRVVVDA